MKVIEAIARYLRLLEMSGKSAHTKRQYRMVLERFGAEHGDELCDEIVAESVMLYLGKLRECGLAAASVAAHDRVLRAFWRQGLSLGWCETDPFRRVDKPAKSRRAPKAASIETLRAMVGACVGELIGGPRRVLALRDLAVILLIADTGCRAGEVAGLRWDDRHDGWCQVTGKGDKDRAVLFGTVTGAVLDEWGRVQGSGGAGWMFTGFGRNRGGMTASGVSQVCHRRAVEAGVNGRPHRAHALRHLFGSSYIQNGDLHSLSRLMGHSDVATTQGYLWLDLSGMREKHEEGSPITKMLTV